MNRLVIGGGGRDFTVLHPVLPQYQLIEPRHQHIPAQPLPGKIFPQRLLHLLLHPGGISPLVGSDLHRHIHALHAGRLHLHKICECKYLSYIYRKH